MAIRCPWVVCGEKRNEERTRISKRDHASGTVVRMFTEPGNSNCDPPPGDRHFHTTRWSLVLAAGQRSTPNSQDALDVLCRTYWYPLYAYVRRRVRDVDEAQDLTQSFFFQVLNKNYLGDAQPERGKFRAFLLTAFKNFLANEWDKAKALKRGGGRTSIPLDFESGEKRFRCEPIDDLTSDRLFDKQWALTLLEHVLNRLREESVCSEKQEQFELLKVFITGSSVPGGFAAVAGKLGMTTGAAKVAAHRLRQRYRAILRDEILQTVAEPSEVDDEIRSLFAILGS